VKRLLDTCAYTAAKRGRPDVCEAIRMSSELVFSTIVLGELLFGFRHGTRFDRNLAELERFLNHPAVRLQPVDRVTADRFGRIATMLKRAGTPIPSNDIWIAAQAMETGAELLTLDSHFEKVTGIAATIFD
jgi:tRNA(fMet)-specific endonuclease VapC